MSHQVLISLIIEVLLVFTTTLLLIQPRTFFGSKGEGQRLSVTISGLFLLSITFCWSVVFGCVIAVQRLAFRL